MKKNTMLIKDFYLSHIWCRISVILLVAVVISTLAGSVYLKEAYVKYIEDKTYNTEKQTMSAFSAVLESSFGELVQLGSTAAVDQKLSDAVYSYWKSGGGSADEKRNMYELIAEYTRRSRWLVASTVMAEGEILYEFDRNLRGGTKEQGLWDEDGARSFGELYEEVQEKVAKKQRPQYRMGTNPILLHGQSVFHIAFPIKGLTLQNTVNGEVPVIVFSVKMELFDEFLNDLYTDSEQMALGYLSDGNGMIFLHRDPDCIGMPQEEYLKEDAGMQIQEGISRTGLTANILIDSTILQAQISRVYGQGMLLYNLFFFIAFGMILFTLRWALRPVDAIKKSIEKVKRGNFQELIPICGRHELWQLAGEYNRMVTAVRTMHEQMERQYEENMTAIRMKQKAEREALESQINAHFICNTLNAINYEVMEAGNYRASLWIKKLSNILRYTFEQKNQNVYMFQEIAWIEQYLFLQKSRLEDTFEYQIDFPEEYMEWPCRKLMLQPFVENSILHGFEGWQRGGFLRISGEKEGDCLKLVIADNGNGMSREREAVLQKVLSEPTAAKKERVGIGISNVVMRMKMYYGERFRISLETEEHHGTSFTFLLPQPAKKEETNDESSFGRR